MTRGARLTVIAVVAAAAVVGGAVLGLMLLRPTTTGRGCPGPAELVDTYVASPRGGDSRSSVSPSSVHCAGPYVSAEVVDPSLPDQLNVLFSISPLRRLRSGTGPVCEVGSGEGGLPAITPAQGAVLNCA